jgi:hypothetical protein
LTNVGASKGLARKQIAPASSARARVLSSGKAVMKMTGWRRPWADVVEKGRDPIAVPLVRPGWIEKMSL